jgi:methylated-DNA-[protein]-cysteine S-methyltransferase
MEIFVEAVTEWGGFAVGATARGISSLFFPGPEATAALCAPVSANDRDFASVRALGEQGATALARYVAGSPLTQVPLDLSWATPFMLDIYRALQPVPLGEIVSYGNLAALAGHPGAQRAVGGAMKRNRVPLFVPCHRVIAARGRVGGWSGQTGWKTRILAREGVHFSKGGCLVSM